MSTTYTAYFKEENTGHCHGLDEDDLKELLEDESSFYECVKWDSCSTKLTAVYNNDTNEKIWPSPDSFTTPVQ